MTQDKLLYRSWEYDRLGDYHRNLDLNWSYAPTYLRKLAVIRQFVKALHPKAKILDLACGEGVLVEEFRKQGRDIQGIDLNYQSEFVQRGNVCQLPFPDGSVDVILFLDALEHLAFVDQPKALAEIYRVLRPNGFLFISIPNLAHLNSRVQFLLNGNLDRTDAELDHIGERPIWENEKLLKEQKFSILKRSGITFTLPFIYRQVICRYPAKFRWLHDWLEPFARYLPSLAMLNYFVCEKTYPTDFTEPEYALTSQLKQQLGSQAVAVDVSNRLDLTRLENQPELVIDLLAVTGCYTYQETSSLLKIWLPRVKEDGLVVIKGFNWAEGVRQAVRELIVPIQCEGGHFCDSIYWTRISHSSTNQNAPYVSVAIPTYKRQEYVLDALQSVIQQKTDFAYEVLIVDNACDLQLKDKIEQIASQSEVMVRYIPVSETGLHNARNAAALQSKAEVIVYIDDDVIVPSGWLAALVEPFEASEVGGVAGKSVAKWEGDRPEWIDLLPASYFSLLDLGEEIRQMQFPDTPYGCNMAFRRRLVLHLGGFPPDGFGGKRVEWYRGDGETGFAQRVYEAQYQIIYTGQSWLYHRIPTQRLTLNSIRSRSIKSAISNFYSQIRQHRYGRKALLQLAVKSGLKALALRLRSVLRRAQSSHNWLLDDLNATQAWITALYQLQLLLNPQLHQWVFRQDYWSKDPAL